MSGDAHGLVGHVHQRGAACLQLRQDTLLQHVAIVAAAAARAHADLVTLSDTSLVGILQNGSRRSGFTLLLSVGQTHHMALVAHQASQLDARQIGDLRTQRWRQRRRCTAAMQIDIDVDE